MYLAYQVLLLLILIISSPYLLFRALIGGHGLVQRLGYWKFMRDDRKIVWFHAASMGELKVINSILPALLSTTPNIRVIISTITKTGRDKALKLFAPVEVYYLPLDLFSCVNRVFRKVKPDLLILIETEIWPVLISEAHRQNTRVAVINGRISERSFKFYKIFKSLFTPALTKIDFVMAQTPVDCERFTALGIDKEKVADFGNIKFDQVLDTNSKSPAPELLSFLNRQNNFVFIAGSIWPKEFTPVVNSVIAVLNNHPELIAVLAPRHLKNLYKLEETLQMSGLAYCLRSQLGQAKSDHKVMILDTMGELSSLYRFADLAFVGGSFVNIGGHDPLEPASAGCAVCFGPNMQNSRMFADIIVKDGGAFYLKDELELTALLRQYVTNKAEAKANGRKAYQAVLTRSGVSRQIAGKLSEFI